MGFSYLVFYKVDKTQATLLTICEDCKEYFSVLKVDAESKPGWRKFICPNCGSTVFETTQKEVD